jgi:hypothetical protein
VPDSEESSQPPQPKHSDCLQLCACAPGKDGRSSQAAADGSVEGGRRNSDEWDLFQPSDVEDVPGTTVPWSGGLIEFIFVAEVSEVTLCVPALRVK